MSPVGDWHMYETYRWVRYEGMEYMNSFLLVVLNAASLIQCEVCNVSVVFLQECAHGELTASTSLP